MLDAFKSLSHHKVTHESRLERPASCYSCSSSDNQQHCLIPKTPFWLGMPHSCGVPHQSSFLTRPALGSDKAECSLTMHVK